MNLILSLGVTLFAVEIQRCLPTASLELMIYDLQRILMYCEHHDFSQHLDQHMFEGLNTYMNKLKCLKEYSIP